jgi:hypothetical protein
MPRRRADEVASTPTPPTGDRSRQAFLGNAADLLADRVRRLRARDVQNQKEVERERAAIEEGRRDREPLGPARWIENEYFSGHLAKDMFDVLKQDFCDIYERNVFEIVMGGAIGWGKTTMCLALQAYSLYLLTCYGVPQRAFRGMMESAQILYMNLNVKAEKAKNAYFVELDTLLKSIPYFQRDFKLTPNLVNEIRLPSKKILCKYSGATKTAAESENLIFCVLDEVNLYDVVEKSKRSQRADERYDAAETVYTSAYRRMLNRFMLPDGTMPLPSKLISLCKETYPDSFIRRRVKEATDNGDVERGRVKVLQYAEWETRPPGTYEKTYFWIKTGTRTTSPKVIEDANEARLARTEIRRLRSEGAPDDRMYQVIQVPTAGGEYVALARKNLPDFIRDQCGRPTESLQMYMSEREPIFEAYREPSEGVPREACDHPFSAHVTDFYDGAFLMADRLCGPPGKDGSRKPLVKPSAPRFLGLDTGLTGDPCGIAMCCVAGFKQVIRAEGADAVYERRPLIHVDLVLSVIPPRGGEIPYAGILGLIFSLTKLGFNIVEVGLDQYQRVAITQPLERKGYKWDRVSTDTSTDPYDVLLDLYMERRISTYPSPPLEGELATLERIRTGKIKNGVPEEKIDHPQHGTKDVADSLARAVFLAERYVAGEAPTFASHPVESGYETPAERDVKKSKAFDEGDFESLYDMVKQDEEDY